MCCGDTGNLYLSISDSKALLGCLCFLAQSALFALTARRGFSGCNRCCCTTCLCALIKMSFACK